MSKANYSGATDVYVGLCIRKEYYIDDRTIPFVNEHKEYYIDDWTIPFVNEHKEYYIDDRTIPFVN